MQVLSLGTSFLIPSSKNSPANSFCQFRTFSFTSSPVKKCFPPMWVFREVKRWKSEGAKSGKYGRWYTMSQPNESNSSLVTLAVWGQALSCNKHTPLVNIPLRLFWIALLSFLRVSQYQTALIISLGQKIDQNDSFLVPKHGGHDFFDRNGGLEFFCWGRRRVSPLRWLYFRLWGVMSHPGLISSHNGAQEILIFQFKFFKISVGVLPSATRNRMTEQTSHLAGFFIDMFHANGHHGGSFDSTEIIQCLLCSGKPLISCSMTNIGNKNFPQTYEPQYSYFLDSPRTYLYMVVLKFVRYATKLNHILINFNLKYYFRHFLYFTVLNL